MISSIHNFIYSHIHNSSNGTSYKGITDTKGTSKLYSRTTGSNSTSKDSTNRNAGFGSKRTSGFQDCSRQCKESRRIISFSKIIRMACREESQGSKSIYREERQTKESKLGIKQKLSFSIFYIDLLDSCPNYAIIMLKELWRNN